jgi:glycosyltransferase involved in cell wall biosynthesis
MIRLVDITFHANSEYADTAALLKAQQASLFYIDAIAEKTEVTVIKHVSAETEIIEKDHFKFFVAKNKRGYISRRTVGHLKELEPDVIIVHGLSFPFHILRLKMMLGKKTKLIAWHHAERPAQWPKKILYWLADQCIAKYLFTSQGNANKWVDAGIINSKNKIAEIPPTLTVFRKQDKAAAKQKTGMNDGVNYLWVGRMSSVKDPFTVIDAFEKFIAAMPSAKLHMIYRPGELLAPIEDRLKQDPALQNNILLHGYVANEALADWYSGADFFILSSLREAGSVTILEAMACGCVPIVTAIPSSLKVTMNGTYGFNYEVGDIDGLVKTLTASANVDQVFFSEKVRTFFEKELSVEAVARKLLAVCESVAGK